MYNLVVNAGIITLSSRKGEKRLDAIESAVLAARLGFMGRKININALEASYIITPREQERQVLRRII